MATLTKRQEVILAYIQKNESRSNLQIKQHLEEKFGTFSRLTVLRDIQELLEKNLLVQEGKGRSVKYKEPIKSFILKRINQGTYFRKDVDERDLPFEKFNFAVFKELKYLLTKEEKKNLEKLNAKYLKNIKKYDPHSLKKEWERLSIELSWKSSRIEGNTYSLIDTEILIKEHKKAKGHDLEEAQMILNHKTALDYIFSYKNEFKKLSLHKIEELHHLLIDKMGVAFGIRKRLVGIIGTRYKPLDNVHQIRDALDKLITSINREKNPFTKALMVLLMISYIQPFEDGNKRTGRITANAILIAHNICPLSYRSVDEVDYKKAVILFYEQNSAQAFKDLFIDQFSFAVKTYFS
ncbi:MAG: Fic family protein [Candidatus Gracilibacteria bacterium]